MDWQGTDRQLSGTRSRINRASCPTGARLIPRDENDPALSGIPGRGPDIIQADYPGPGQGPIKTGLNFYTGEGLSLVFFKNDFVKRALISINIMVFIKVVLKIIDLIFAFVKVGLV